MMSSQEIEKLKDLYNQNYSIARLAEMTFYCEEHIRKTLRKNGATIRRRGRPAESRIAA